MSGVCNDMKMNTIAATMQEGATLLGDLRSLIEYPFNDHFFFHRAAGDFRQTVYMSSRLSHANKWRYFRDTEGVRIVSSWIDGIDDKGLPKPDEDIVKAWETNIKEARHAEFTILYCEPGERLKGALVEIGAALAAGRRVLSVGKTDAISMHSTGELLGFTKLPNWTVCESLSQAFEITGHKNIPEWGDVQAA